MRPGPIDKAMKIKDSLFQCEKGATAVEYGLIVALIFLAVFMAIGQVAGEVISMWNKVAEAHNNI